MFEFGGVSQFFLGVGLIGAAISLFGATFYKLLVRHHPLRGPLLRDPEIDSAYGGMAFRWMAYLGDVGGRALNAADASGHCRPDNWIKDRISIIGTACAQEDIARTGNGAANAIGAGATTAMYENAAINSEAAKQCCYTTRTGGFTCVGAATGAVGLIAGGGAVLGAGGAGVATSASLVATGSQAGLTVIACKKAWDRDCAWKGAMTGLGVATLGFGIGAKNLGPSALRSRYFQSFMADSWNYWLGLSGTNLLPRIGTVGGGVTLRGLC